LSIDDPGHDNDPRTSGPLVGHHRVEVAGLHPVPAVVVGGFGPPLAVLRRREYERFYNLHRPHQGMANVRPLKPLSEPITDPATITHLHIRRHDRLGGLLHEYEHAD
jgi:hypothetical protein